MNKKSKEIVKKLCFTLVVVISIITIIGCPNTVSNKTNSGADKPIGNSIPWTPLYDPNDWSGLTADQVIQKMKITDEVIYSLRGLGFGKKGNQLCYLSNEKAPDGGYAWTGEEIKEIWNSMGEGAIHISDTFSSFCSGLEKRWESESVRKIV